MTSMTDSPAYLRRSATTYLDGVAVEFAQIKLALLDLLGPTPGARVLDVGCGTGVDVFAAAERIGPTGQAVGVDMSEELVTQAKSRADATLPVAFQTADATALPFEDEEFDAVRSERVFQHIPDPIRAATEVARVTAPGGRVVIADPDHGMWALDMSDRQTTETLMAWWISHIKNPWMGRQLPGLLREAGVQDVTAEVLPVALTSLASADAVIGLSKTAQWAANAGVVDADAAKAWHEELVARDSEGRFLLAGALIAAHGHKANGDRAA
jgi:ubiquinone/menaquinone biosynthesis C-methylase UbiE